ncbi:MAG: NADH-quinone oxidoreductase subunit L [Bacteroidota bacterium]
MALISIALVIFLIPLTAFAMNVIAPKSRARMASYISIILLVISTVLSSILLLRIGSESAVMRMDWFAVGSYTFEVGVLLDFQGVFLLFTVNMVSLLVHIYSALYMAKDPGYGRYFGFLSLFTFAMAGIILSDNLLMVFVFWELVGLSSYLLIGHWYTKDSASKASKKAFIVNRIGDAGFIMALCIIWYQFGTFNLDEIQVLMDDSQLQNGFWVSAVSALPAVWLSFMGIGLFMAAVGKSAQFPLQVWLPDAMEGPTPVSALIHAATMVAAGVFLMSRVVALLDATTLATIATVGSITAFMGAVAALTQYDIKKVLAYSTISQLGYMLIGIGTGAYEAALFHLFTHAFFKAALFLAAGSVIHSLHALDQKHNLNTDAQDMRSMGGLKSNMPVTFYTYLIAAFSLMGLPLFSGFLSKDALLVASLNWSAAVGPFAYGVPLLAFATVALTAFYMGRQLLLVFFGDFRSGLNVSDTREGGWHFKVPLIILGTLSIGLFWSFNPFDYTSSWLLNTLPAKLNSTPQFDLEVRDMANHSFVGVGSIALVLVGVLLAWLKFKQGKALTFAETDQLSFLGRLSINNWYLDKFYEKTILSFIRWCTSVLAQIEKKVIDRLVNLFGWVGVIVSFVIGWLDKVFVDGLVNFSAFFSSQVGGMTKSFQYGKAQSFIIFALVSLLLIIFFIL